MLAAAIWGTNGYWGGQDSCNHVFPVLVHSKEEYAWFPVCMFSVIHPHANTSGLCKDFIDKPFSPEEIEKRITSLLNDLSIEDAEKARKEYSMQLPGKHGHGPEK